MRNLIFLLLIVVVGVSCVPNRKIVYLQKGDELKESFPKDTVLRTYDLADYEYRIQPEDILSIRIESLTNQEYNIFNQTQSSSTSSNLNSMLVNGYLVDENGQIEFPVEGKVSVGGLTILEANQKIQVVANRYLKNSTVYVRLLNFRVTVVGEVSSPGIVSTVNNRMSIMEAVGMAGGLTELADRHQVKLVRQSGDSVAVSYINLLDENYLASNLYYAHQNDIIIVPPLKQRPFRRYFGQNISIFLSSLSTLLLILNLVNN